MVATHPNVELPAVAPHRWRALVLLSVAELLGMSLWFSASAVVPALSVEWNLTDSQASWLTISVQLGFVFGTLLSAFLNLADIFKTRHLLAVCAFAGAATNALFALVADGPAKGIALRFVTGMFLAGVYPPAMKLMATWFRQSRGLALGILVGALTLGKASPYLINAFGSASWRTNVMDVSVLAAVGGALVLIFVVEGPYAPPRAQFDWQQIVKIFRNRGVRLANFGYFGHMWELYAMWTWVPLMLRASFASQGVSPQLAEIGSFIVIGAGALGCAVAGLIADRVGRTAVTSWAMAISGSSCLIVGFLFGASPVLLLVVTTIWGATVVADSAQFSSCVTELGDPQYIGTALTLQMSIGFLLTTISIQLIPPLVNLFGWRYAFIVLAPGPLFGVLAMLRLRSLPEAAKIAHGRR
jgi:MFS family permease